MYKILNLSKRAIQLYTSICSISTKMEIIYFAKVTGKMETGWLLVKKKNIHRFPYTEITTV